MFEESSKKQRCIQSTSEHLRWNFFCESSHIMVQHFLCNILTVALVDHVPNKKLLKNKSILNIKNTWIDNYLRNFNPLMPGILQNNTHTKKTLQLSTFFQLSTFLFLLFQYVCPKWQIQLKTEACLVKPSRTSLMELFCENS